MDDPRWSAVTGDYVDPDGNPISFLRWAELRSDFEACTLAEDPVGPPHARGVATVRTMWLGDHQPQVGALPFGTGLVCAGHAIELGTYLTRDAALAGHTAHLATYLKQYLHQQYLKPGGDGQ